MGGELALAVKYKVSTLKWLLLRGYGGSRFEQEGAENATKIESKSSKKINSFLKNGKGPRKDMVFLMRDGSRKERDRVFDVEQVYVLNDKVEQVS